MLELRKKYGCLTILDDGTEYSQSEKVAEFIEKRNNLLTEMQPIIDKREHLIAENPSLFELEKQHLITSENHEFHCQLFDINFKINMLYQKLHDIESIIEPHYKCQCKCGRIHYYNQKTIESEPKYCFYPVPISTRFTYSVRAQNATYNKKEKYANIECVTLRDKSECIPSNEYCERYNAYKVKQLSKNEEKLRLEIAEIPRVHAENFDIDYVGRMYESLLIEECCNDHLESKPTFSFSQQHHKCWHKIIVYKQYKCRCILCGKVQMINCDKFGIFAPTEYGYRAYNGYWSDVCCDCHNISSFQWIVNKLLFDNGINYQVEYSFPDLIGTHGTNKLRFDFAVMNDDGSIKILIECQGEQHFMPVEEFGGVSQFITQVKNDERKREYTQKHGIPLLEISYKDKKYEIVENILKKHTII